MELRLDYMAAIDTGMLKLIAPLKERVILTVRDPSEGGINKFPDSIKFRFLKAASEEGFRCDTEAAFMIRHPSLNSFIVSMHYIGKEVDLAQIYGAMNQLSGRYDYFKIAGEVGPETREKLISLLNSGSRIAVMEIGGDPMARIAYSILGSSLIYCHLGEPTAKGQIQCQRVSDIINEIWS